MIRSWFCDRGDLASWLAESPMTQTATTARGARVPCLCTGGFAFQSTRMVSRIPLGVLNLRVGPEALFPWSLLFSAANISRPS